MNSDPYDSAAWRAFGMLDADESALFDETMRHDPVLRDAMLDMDRISAAIAVANARPVAPQPWRFDQLRSRLGLSPARRSWFWLAATGWAAAAALALILIFTRASAPPRIVETTPPEILPPAITPAAPTTRPADATADADADASADASAGTDAVAPADPSPPALDGDIPPAESRAATRAETRRLVQEIEVLREDLAKFQQRDRILFEAVPGMALPIMVKMSPPGQVDPADGESHASGGDSPVAALLADGQRAAAPDPRADHFETTTDPAAAPGAAPPADAGGEAVVPAPPPPPTAIPIYDSARDNGTLVVNHLPPAAAGEAYNLWVQTAVGGGPIFVGSLPEITGGSLESFDFSLGSNMVLPTRFILTLDTTGQPTAPAESNIVLEGPPPDR